MHIFVLNFQLSGSCFICSYQKACEIKYRMIVKMLVKMLTTIRVCSTLNCLFSCRRTCCTYSYFGLIQQQTLLNKYRILYRIIIAIYIMISQNISSKLNNLPMDVKSLIWSPLIQNDIWIINCMPRRISKLISTSLNA